jgi:wyosine [tRNA(Phe)-imidazoG37] synthetase (radical SAM superfamily)
LGWLIHECKKRWEIPIAVITNGSLLFMEDVRQDLLGADVVLPSLDAGSEKVFKTINRPHGKIKYESMLQGQIDFRREYKGKIWMEVMLVKGMNDSDESLIDLKKNIKCINPDRIYINIPIRPPAELGVEPPRAERILKAQELLGKVKSITNYEYGEFGIGEFPDAHSAILEISYRHPLREEQAREIEQRFSEKGIVDSMLSKSEIVRVEYRGKIYLLPKRFVRG